MPGPAPVVLAYSGRPDSAAAIGRLSAAAGAPVVTVTLDLGQGADLEQIAADVLLPALRAGATGAGVGVRAAALARPTLVKALVDIAKMEGATRVAHGASGDDRRAMDLLLSELAPDLSVVGVAADSGGPSEPAVAANLWGRTVTVPSGVDPETLPASLLYERTSQPAACQALPATVELTFERSLPVAVNGIAMPFVEIVEVVETIAGDHGVGRRDTSLASGVREISEAPAAVTLGLALAEIERTTLAPRLAALKASLSWAYAAAIDDGAWFSTSRTALDAFVAAASAGVSGVVRVQLFRGECRVAEPDTTAAVGPHLSSVEAGL